ncbi:hypothetical protein ACRAWF_20020 [Streptomyces sp. L7]
MTAGASARRPSMHSSAPPMGIGGGLGLPIAAAIAQYANWRALFWGSARVFAAVVAALDLVPDPRRAPAAAKGQPLRRTRRPRPRRRTRLPCCSVSPRARVQG